MPAPPYVRDSDTSAAAADQIAPHTAGLRAEVFSYIKRRGSKGATCWETEVALGMQHQTASARIRELFLSNDLFDSGDRRNTGTGRKAVVWRTPSA